MALAQIQIILFILRINHASYNLGGKAEPHLPRQIGGVGLESFLGLADIGRRDQRIHGAFLCFRQRLDAIHP